MHTPTNPPDALLDPEQAAAFLNVSPKTLNVWRCTKRVKLPYVKVGARVRYRRADLENFIGAAMVEG